MHDHHPAVPLLALAACPAPLRHLHRLALGRAVPELLRHSLNRRHGSSPPCPHQPRRSDLTGSIQDRSKTQRHYISKDSGPRAGHVMGLIATLQQIGVHIPSIEPLPLDLHLDVIPRLQLDRRFTLLPERSLDHRQDPLHRNASEPPLPPPPRCFLCALLLPASNRHLNPPEQHCTRR
eukprot:973342-Rhodomonas_salina.2